MFRLALHWQILIGTAIGSLVGLILNVTASTSNVSLSKGLPDAIASVEIRDSSALTKIQYTTSTETVQRVVDPLRQTVGSVRSVEELRQIDPLAANLYQQYGQSTAKRFGEWFRRIGGLFLRMLKMVAVPLIVTSLLTGILGLGSADEVGRMFGRTMLYYLVTSLLAIVTGLLVVNLIRPGLADAPSQITAPVESSDSLGEILFAQVQAIIPSNPLSALTEPNYLSIIAFTIAFGIFTVRVGGTTAQRIQQLAGAGFDVMMAMTMAIIRLAPIGVFFLIADVTATQGADVIRALGWYFLSVMIALVIHAAITLPLIVWLVARRSPLEFAKALSPALLTAFSSASSNATLPLTLSNVETRAGISNKTGSFVLPLGATINMDGTALYEAVAVLFIAQLHYGVNLPLSQQVLVALTALLASVGAAGIPHAGLVMMVIILQVVGLPLEMQGVILAVDRLLDMARTAVNVWGDACGCAVVERFELER
jgi:proton glutamate symport protein